MKTLNRISRIENSARALPVQFESLEDLAKLITTSDWSQSIFRDNHRREENFICASVIALDIDKGLNLNDAVELFKHHKHVIVTTRNHQVAKGEAPACDRFRVVLFPEKRIDCVSDFRDTWRSLANTYPFIDHACKDASRFWYKGQTVISINETGLGIPIPEISSDKRFAEMMAILSHSDTPPSNTGNSDRGELAKKTKDIVKNGMPVVGERNVSMFKAALDFKQQGYSMEETVEDLSGKSTLPEQEENSAIKNGYNTKPKYPPRIPPAKQKRIATQDWVNKWLLENRTKYSIKTGEVLTNGESTTMEEMLAKISLDADRVNGKYGETKINYAITLWKRQQKDAAILKLKSEIAYDPSTSGGYIAEFLTAVTGHASELDVGVLQHFVWQIKRKLHSQSMAHHIMPIFVGKTGAGKTEAVRRLLDPIDGFSRAPQDMTVINDERAIKVCNDAYCIFFDEMAKANKVDVDRLKNIISQSTITYRPMRTNQTCTIANNAVFIGAANHTIKELIYDPTSARRFWQITTLDAVNRALVNSIDYKKLWQSIDETLPSPIMPLIEQITEVQNVEFRHMGNVEEWVTNFCDVIPEDTKLADWLNPLMLYDEYKNWLDWQGCQPTKYQTFLDQIANYKKRVDGNTEYFEINGSIFQKRRTGGGMKYSLKPRRNYANVE